MGAAKEKLTEAELEGTLLLLQSLQCLPPLGDAEAHVAAGPLAQGKGKGSNVAPMARCSELAKSSCSQMH